MLSRSGETDELLASLRPLVLDETSRWNRLVQAFTPEETEEAFPRANAYLPYAFLPVFRQFAEDWLALLRCRMPGYDVNPHLVDLLGLQVILYKLQCAEMWASPASPLQLVLEMIGHGEISATWPWKRIVTTSAAVRPLTPTCEKWLTNRSRWTSALQHADAFGEAYRVLRSKVAWPDADMDEYSGAELLAVCAVPSRAQAHPAPRLRHLANVHGQYAHEIGLVVRRGTRRVRYAPNDQILRSIVFANVERRMEFQQFLSVLYERYGFVIGHRQAGTFIDQGQSDQKSFEDNARRLELRLASLGLLRRLSDACAY